MHDLGRDTRPHGFSGRHCSTRNTHVSPRSLLAAQPWDQATFLCSGVGIFFFRGTYSSHSLPWTALSSSAVILCPVVK